MLNKQRKKTGKRYTLRAGGVHVVGPQGEIMATYQSNKWGRAAAEIHAETLENGGNVPAAILKIKIKKRTSAIKASRWKSARTGAKRSGARG